MMTQPPLDFTKPLTRADKFHEFHAKNPQVISQLEEIANMTIKSGQEHFSINYLFEVVRYLAWTKTNDVYSDFKLNNNYRSHYARLMIERNPKMAKIIKTRALRSA